MNRETGSDCAFSELLVGAKCIGSRGSMPDRARGAYIVLPILPSWWDNGKPFPECPPPQDLFLATPMHIVLFRIIL